MHPSMGKGVEEKGEGVCHQLFSTLFCSDLVCGLQCLQVTMFISITVHPCVVYAIVLMLVC